MVFVDRIIGKPVAAAVGLASESISAHKANKAHKNEQQDADQDKHEEVGEWRDGEWDIPELDGSEVLQFSNEDEHHWDLDEAQDRLREADPTLHPAPLSINKPIDQDQLAHSFAQQYPLPATYQKPSLPYPVVLPQRRPRSRARGFVRAYAPDLAAFGITQDMFIDFIDTANKSCQGSGAIGLINLAALAGMHMGIEGLLISIALQIATYAATAFDGRRKSNNFFDKANHDFFMPRGLFCLVMTWNPEIDDAFVTFDMNQSIDKAMTRGGGGFGKLKHKFQKSDGASHGNELFSAIAPLEFPDLDRLAEDADEETRKKHDSFKESTKRKLEFAAAYRDKRAQARFNDKNPDSALSQGPKPEFTSRYADPNHSASEGSFVSLLTGGRFTGMQLWSYTPEGYLVTKGIEKYKKSKAKKASQAALISTGDVHQGTDTEVGLKDDVYVDTKETSPERSTVHWTCA